MKATYKNLVKEAKYNVEYLNECVTGDIKTSVPLHILKELLNKWETRYKLLRNGKNKQI